MKKLMIALACAACLTACTPNEDVYVRSYVVQYYEIDYFEYTAGGKYIILRVGRIPGSVSGRAYTRYVSFTSKGEDKEYYDALCLKHKDMSYNRKVTVNGASQSIFYHNYLATDFVSVEISSDSDFNESHMAGESLGDIVSLCSLSPVPYITSGYKKTYNWKEADDTALSILSFFTGYPENFKVNSLHPVYKRVSELTPDDLYLLGDGYSVTYIKPWAYFKFEELPTLSKEHKITVTMTADDGKVYSGKVDMVFD